MSNQSGYNVCVQITYSDSNNVCMMLYSDWCLDDLYTIVQNSSGALDRVIYIKSIVIDVTAEFGGNAETGFYWDSEFPGVFVEPDFVVKTVVSV